MLNHLKKIILMDFEVGTVGVDQHVVDLERHDLGAAGEDGLPLGGDALAPLIGLSLEPVIFLDPGDEGGPAVGFPEVLPADVQPLLDDPVADLLVDHDAQTLGVHVEDAPGPAVVEEMGHSGVDGPVDDDIHVLPHLDLLQVVLHSNGPVSPERSGEFVSGSRSVSSRFTHFLYIFGFTFI